MPQSIKRCSVLQFDVEFVLLKDGKELSKQAEDCVARFKRCGTTTVHYSHLNRLRARSLLVDYQFQVRVHDRKSLVGNDHKT
jgi:hypothetical protein